MTAEPLVFSVIVPVWNPEPEHLRACIDSVMNQTTSAWELILICDGPQPAPVMAEIPSDHPKVVVVERETNGGIVAASNDGIAVATGDFIAFLDNDDVLLPHALGTCAWELSRWDDVDVLYTDEDKLDANERRYDAFHKPAWSPERLRTQMYLGHLCVYRRTLVNEVGGLREEFNGSQDHDLALRATEQARRIIHVPRICYHWRAAETSTAFDPAAKDWAFEAGVRAVQSHLDRVSIDATAVRHPTLPGVISLEPAPHDGNLVSIVIPTSGGSKLIAGRYVSLIDNAVRSIVETSTAENYEIIAVLDRNGTAETVDRIAALAPERLRVVQDQEPFHFSGACNLGALEARGDTLIFLNDDTEVITPDWIERLNMHANLPGVGAVGAKLLFPDGRIQHCGIFSRDGAPSHRYMHMPGDHPGQFGCLNLVSNAIAVTGACLAIRTDRYRQVGGLTMSLPLNFNDVDFCLKLLREGWRNVVDASVQLVHYESATRKPVVDRFELDIMHDRWWDILSHDPYDNPNLIGFRTEELPPPTALTQVREINGSAVFHGRSWPLEAPALNGREPE